MALARSVKEKKGSKNDAETLEVKILKPGDALFYPKFGDTLSVHYIGKLPDGTVFDDSYKRGVPFYFILGAGQVILGWEQAFPNMSRGQKNRISVPATLAYGEKGFPPIIPPYTQLIFEIELISFSSVGAHNEIFQRKPENLNV